MQYPKDLQLKLSNRSQKSCAEDCLLCGDLLVNLNALPVRSVPWHWNEYAELFYVESGCVEFATVSGTVIFSKGSGGFINAGVIHMMRWGDSEGDNILRMYRFDVSSLLDLNCRDTKQLRESQIGLVPILKEESRYTGVLKEMGKLWEGHARQKLNYYARKTLIEIVQDIIKQESPLTPMENRDLRIDKKLKMMITYIQQHYQEPFRTDDIAKASQLSKHSCYRFFREKLLTTPGDYTSDVRLYFACIMLSETNEFIETIAVKCGFCTSSYLAELFKRKFACTPMQYRMAKRTFESIN